MCFSVSRGLPHNTTRICYNSTMNIINVLLFASSIGNVLTIFCSVIFLLVIVVFLFWDYDRFYPNRFLETRVSHVGYTPYDVYKGSLDLKARFQNLIDAAASENKAHELRGLICMLLDRNMVHDLRIESVVDVPGNALDQIAVAIYTAFRRHEFGRFEVLCAKRLEDEARGSFAKMAWHIICRLGTLESGFRDEMLREFEVDRRVVVEYGGSDSSKI